MDLESGLLAPTCLIEAPYAAGEATTTSSLVAGGGPGAAELDLGLFDLGIAWEMCDLVGHTVTMGSGGNSGGDNYEAAAPIHHNGEERDPERRAVSLSEYTRLDSLDLLELEINNDVLSTLNHFESLESLSVSPNTALGTSSSEWASFASSDAHGASSECCQINSPTAELTMANLLRPMTSPDLLEAAPSPSESTASSEPMSRTEKGLMRRTRGRTIDKKQSNKAAAIKYRNKKTLERAVLFTECDEFEKKNAELKRKISETQAEISFIKSLLVEALLAKNLVK